LFENTNKIISRFSFKEEEEHFDYICPTMTLIFVELPKFNKSVDELESLADKWIYFIREAPNLEMVPESLETTAPIQQAFGIANTVNLSRKELDQLEAQVFYMQDQQRSREESLETGLERGLQQGLQQGLQRQINIAIRLLERKLGTLDESIKSRIAQLSSDRIDSLTEAVLDFNSADDLVSWLQEMGDR
jgi:predicted transposase/invertase (TIGR01784 family)